MTLVTETTNAVAGREFGQDESILRASIRLAMLLERDGVIVGKPATNQEMWDADKKERGGIIGLISRASISKTMSRIPQRPPLGVVYCGDYVVEKTNGGYYSKLRDEISKNRPKADLMMSAIDQVGSDMSHTLSSDLQSMMIGQDSKTNPRVSLLTQTLGDKLSGSTLGSRNKVEAITEALKTGSPTELAYAFIKDGIEDSVGYFMQIPLFSIIEKYIDTFGSTPSFALVLDIAESSYGMNTAVANLNIETVDEDDGLRSMLVESKWREYGGGPNSNRTRLVSYRDDMTEFIFDDTGAPIAMDFSPAGKAELDRIRKLPASEEIARCPLIPPVADLETGQGPGGKSGIRDVWDWYIKDLRSFADA